MVKDMQCPTCEEQLLNGPTFGPRTTYRYCLDCGRNWTLDGYEVIEPADYWLSEKAERYIRDHWGRTCHPHLTEREWRHWFRTQWLELHPEG